MALTKVSGDILDTGIVVSGVVTATSFDGPITGNVTGSATSISGTPDITVRNISGVGATFTGNVSIGGTLTYQDVTNVDSTGIATARVGLDILSGGLNMVGLTTGLHVSGVSTFTGAINGNVTGNVTGNISGGTVAGSTGRFSGDVSIADKIIHTGDTDTAIRFPSADIISFETAGSQRLNINSVGQIGIRGTTAAFDTTGDPNNGALQLHYSTNSGQASIGPYSSGGSTHLSFYTNAGGAAATEKLRIGSDGHITPAAAGTQDLGSTSKEFRHLYLGDSGKAFFGLDQDVAIYNATNFHIEKTGTDGSGIRIHVPTNESIEFQQAQATVMATFTANGSCSLYNNTVKRIETSSTGVTVTGEVAASQDYPNYRPTLDFNFAAVKKLDPRITYNRTGPASYVDEYGIVKLVAYNVPRFDHDPTTRESKGLLIEEQRTNQMINSSDITGDTAQNGTITGDATTAPDGTTTADKYAANSTNGIHRVDMPFTSGQLSNSTAYTFSVFVKANGYDKLHIRYAGYNADNHGLGYDLSDGTTFAGKYDGTSALGAVTSSSMIAYPNGWYRCSFTVTTAGDASGGVAQILYYISNSESTTNFAGDGSSGMYFWGAQMEVGSFPTSLIPTDGETRTRGVDLCQITGQEFSDFYNQSEGTIVTEHNIATGVASGDNTYVYQIDDGSDTNVGWRLLDHNSAHGDLLRAYGFVGGAWGSPQYGFDSSTPAHNTFLKVALGMKNNDFGINFFGGTTATDTSGSVTGNGDMVQLTIGNHRGGTAPLQGHMRRFIYYPQKLTTNQLKTITS